MLTALVVVFVVDLSGFTQSWKNALGKWLHVDAYNLRVKPFDCSLCMVWWTTLVVAAVIGHFTLPMVAYCAALAFTADLAADAVRLAKMVIVKFFDMISKWIQ